MYYLRRYSLLPFFQQLTVWNDDILIHILKPNFIDIEFLLEQLEKNDGKKTHGKC